MRFLIMTARILVAIAPMLSAGPARPAQVVNAVGLSGAPEGWAFAKAVRLEPGGVLTGVTWVSNDPGTVFPEVRLLAALDDLRLGRALSTVRRVGGPPLVGNRGVHPGASEGHLRQVSFDPPVKLPEGGTVYLVVTLPTESSVSGMGRGAGVGVDAEPADGSNYVVSLRGEPPIQLGENLAIHFLGTGIVRPAVAESPKTFVTKLAGASPSPFKERLTVEFEIASETRVDLAVYDVAGRVLKSLRSEVLAPGRYSDDWDGSLPSGRQVHGGVYFVRFRTPGASQTLKVLRVQ